MRGLEARPRSVRADRAHQCVQGIVALETEARQLRRLHRMAEQLGMESLGAVAADLRRCLDIGDATAFSAVWARLLRVAERSLAVDKALLDQSL